MSSMRFSGYFDFYFTTQTQGGDINNYFIDLSTHTNEFNKNIQQTTQSVQGSSQSLRRLALDVRLVSSSIRQITTALGLQETAFGQISTVVTVTSGILVGLISTSNAYARVAKLVADSGGMSAIQQGLWASATGEITTATALFIPVLVALVAGMWAFNTAFNETSGINSYKDSIKSLETEIEGLEGSIKSLSLAQQGFGVQSASLAAQQSTLDAQFKQGLITEEEYDKQTQMLEVNRANLGAQTSELAYQEKFYQHELAQSKASIDDYNKAIEDTNEVKNKTLNAALSDPLGMIGGTLAGIVSPDAWGALFRGMGLPGFASGGTVSRTGPILAHAGEQVIPAGESGGGGMNLTISLAGANIFGAEGVEEALQVGGNELKKQLEYMRRPRSRW